jgi:Plasmid pRiA4b ORF-3-like protein
MAGIECRGAFVPGVWQFKVSLGDAWRRIVVPADDSTDTLISGILQAFRFDSDHLYELKLRDRSGRSMRIGHPHIYDVEYYTDQFDVGCLPLDPGQKMTFVFDFGDTWEFDVRLEKILPEGAAKKLKVIERQGKPPKQYDNDDCW